MAYPGCRILSGREVERLEIPPFIGPNVVMVSIGDKFSPLKERQTTFVVP